MRRASPSAEAQRLDVITPLYSGADLERAGATDAGAARHGNGGSGRTVGALLRHLIETARKMPLLGCRELITTTESVASDRDRSV